MAGKPDRWSFRNRLGIRSKLFISYTLMICLIITTLSFFFYTRLSSVVRERSLESSSQMLQRVDESLAQAVKDLDRISAQVIYNSDFQNRFEEAFTTVESYEVLEARNAFVRILATLNGPSFIAQQINVFNLEGDFISYGLKIDPYDIIRERIGLLSWVGPTLSKEGDKQLNPPHKDELFRSGEQVFSISRLFPNSSAENPKFVEVQQSYDTLAAIVGDAAEQTGSKLYVMDDQGLQFYPAPDGSNQRLPFQWESIPKLASDTFHNRTETVNGEKVVIGWLRSSSSGLTVIAAQSEKELLKPVNSLRNVVITVSAASVGLALMLAYWLASTITHPLRLILRDVRRLDLEQFNFNTLIRNKGTYRKASYEIKELYDGFITMKGRLNLSLEQLLDAQKRENLAHVRALHNQMQPHFIFNTLSSIAVLAENAGAEHAAAMSYKMMRMMEYISRPTELPIGLGEEIEFTENYLELMKLRYQSGFSYSLHIDKMLKGIALPKFVLQPLVENSFEHGFATVNPPWHLSIEARAGAESGTWLLRIRDNGSGFGTDALQRIEHYIRDMKARYLRQLDLIGDKGLGGLGLENTFMRLYLYYNGNVRFTILNLEEGMELVIACGHKEEMAHV